MSHAISNLNSAATDAYNQLMSDVSANGTSAATLNKDADRFLALSKLTGKDSNTDTAVENMKTSLGNGTYSQQGTQGALMGAASEDGMKGAHKVQIEGAAGNADQNNGQFDGGSSFHNPANGGHGDLAANTDILHDEIRDGAPSSQITNNARALENEANQSGNTALATAAQNIINSQSDGTYNAAASQTALYNALATTPNS